MLAFLTYQQMHVQHALLTIACYDTLHAGNGARAPGLAAWQEAAGFGPTNKLRVT